MPGRPATPYIALGDYLAARAAAGERRAWLAFDAIEGEILGRPLPATARSRRHGRDWWHDGGHAVHAWEGWLRAGWRVAAVDLAGETVTFVRGEG